ncbi:PTS sugar transporter subunit IIB [Kluyvera sp. STS39-E]|uniref:PTS sugar transporter subunit IIB n=1 Tax=Kluyvera sp. STS39-E TaxID=3234748 RepID=UPI0034C6A2EE
MNISIFCNSGMSTSMMAKKLHEAYINVGCQHNIKAYDFSSLQDIAPESDVIILGPQIAWAQEDVVRDYPDKYVIVLGIQEFGGMNGEALKIRIDSLINN